jgi:hypothetical protein
MMSHACTILGGGPSLKAVLDGPEPEFLYRGDVIAVNNAALTFLNVIGYFTDADWFYRYEDRLKHRRGRTIRGYLPGDRLSASWLEQWEFSGELGLPTEPKTLTHGFNSGFAAIVLAVQLGYTKIRLLGYDMRVVDGQTNFHSDHVRTTPQEAYERQFKPAFESLVEPLKERGIEVVNATPDSALTCFPMSDDVLVNPLNVFSEKTTIFHRLPLAGMP